jgi:hypothetical protein
MANKPKIIEMQALTDDAVKSVATPEPFEPEADETEAATPAEPAPQKLSAAEAAERLRQLSSGLAELYTRYAKLHGLAKELNGVPESAPFPEHVQLARVSVVYSINGGEDVVSDILNTQHVGEIGGLLRVEIERLVDQILLSLSQIREISTAAEQACNQAKFYSRMSQSKNVPT